MFFHPLWNTPGHCVSWLVVPLHTAPISGHPFFGSSTHVPVGYVERTEGAGRRWTTRTHDGANLLLLLFLLRS
uniref:Putative secreted peptide n=1 Tax=Anopheles braziliensis TaxID=58242 RepID=A0A2M3ZVB1_9DIPT